VSAVAGAIWYPFLAEPRERVLGWSRTTFHRLVALAREPDSGVRLEDVVEVFARPDPDLWWAPAAGPIENVPAGDVPPPFRAAIRTRVPVCATPVHLPWLRARAAARGVVFTRRAVTSFAEAFAHARVVVNCAGLGAGPLCGDTTLRPVRGQVVVVAGRPVPHAWIDDTNEQPFYVVPRGDDTVLGGTAQTGDARLAADAEDTRAIVAGLAARFPAVRAADVRAVRVGLRPWRPTVRVEAERLPGGRLLVHDYGHGGSGYTLAWGCAEEVASLVAAG
jgi:D-amino-acid oxidase